MCSTKPFFCLLPLFTDLFYIHGKQRSPRPPEFSFRMVTKCNEPKVPDVDMNWYLQLQNNTHLPSKL